MVFFNRNIGIKFSPPYDILLLIYPTYILTGMGNLSKILGLYIPSLFHGQSNHILLKVYKSV